MNKIESKKLENDFFETKGNREKIIETLSLIEGKELGEEVSKLFIQFGLAEIDNDPVCNKHLSLGTELLQEYEKIRTKLSSKETDLFLLEQEFKNLLTHIYQEELADCVLDSDLDQFESDLKLFLSKLRNSKNIVLTPELNEKLDYLENELEERKNNKKDGYVADTWLQNELKTLGYELKAYNSNFELTREMAELENSDYLKIPEFTENLNSILDHKLGVNLGNMEIFELNNEMAEFLQKNNEYNQVWENITTNKPLNPKELNKFVSKFISFSKLSLGLILISFILTGCGNGNGYDEKGNVKEKVTIGPDGKIRQESNAPELSFSLKDGATTFSKGSAEGRRLLKIQAGLESNGYIDFPENISPEKQTMVVGVDMKTIIMFSSKIKNPENVNIHLRYTDESGILKEVSTEYLDPKIIEFVPTKPHIEIWFTSDDNRTNVPMTLGYHPLPEQKRSFLGWLHDNLIDSPTTE